MPKPTRGGSRHREAVAGRIPPHRHRGGESDLGAGRVTQRPKAPAGPVVVRSPPGVSSAAFVGRRQLSLKGAVARSARPATTASGSGPGASSPYSRDAGTDTRAGNYTVRCSATCSTPRFGRNAGARPASRPSPATPPRPRTRRRGARLPRRNPRAGPRQPQARAVRGRPPRREAPSRGRADLRRGRRARPRTERGGWRGRWHAQNWWRSTDRYVLPRIGGRPVSEINTADVLEILTPIWHVKAETVAKAVRHRIRSVLEWAVAMKWRPDNPCDLRVISGW